MGGEGLDERPPASMQLFSKKLRLSAGAFRHGSGESAVGPMRRGLKVAVLLEGHQSYQLDDRPARSITGPTLLVACNRGDHIQRRRSLADESLRVALVQIDSDFAESEFGASFDELMERGERDAPGLWIRSASTQLQAIALQMAECRIQGSMRGLYLGGKALELAAMVVDELVNERPARPQRLSPRGLQQIHAARDVLLASVQDPPSLNELAKMTGLNATKLTSGFRLVFGTSVFGYLQEHRLQQAYELIRSGGKSVTEAAFHVGYNPAHFSGLFRKRFGVLPSALR
jgi:AraC family transcriptional regulator, transcriptional activator of the genes for pyochelin and ferripyochelin receptors